MTHVDLRPLTPADRNWVRQFIITHWGGEDMVVHGQIFRPHEHEGIAAYDGEQTVGLITYRVDSASSTSKAGEILSLDSLREGEGIGTALLSAAIAAVRACVCTQLTLVTTNDNIRALAFYQKRGFVIAAVRLGAVAAARRFKPTIPLVAENGIPIRDEIEMAIDLSA